ncbi:metallophosphoesterase family protein [Dermatobacter hominis]|uniref:metallophosphoesterase family protein n=1 Tax=Dermatobacter hominis TaxID=2884263 RepID=UPI001D120A65|nr:metallophosphoesterase [Dermatobacter hominis]UDY35168.1 metallophosphoesterase [Dermatobacter hominis]
MIRVAAVGDLHVGRSEPPVELLKAAEEADLLLLAGDLTNCGDAGEARSLAACLADVEVPVVAVLGNHDHHAETPEEVVAELRGAGVVVLDGEACHVALDGTVVGVAGTKGFACGLPGTCATAFGEPEMKRFVEVGRLEAERFGAALAELDAPHRIGLLHYSPIGATVAGEPPEIHAFLADHRLAEQADEHGADLLLHGHAHSGREHGETPGGIPVRNVARPVIRAPYRIYTLGA